MDIWPVENEVHLLEIYKINYLNIEKKNKLKLKLKLNPYPNNSKHPSA